jgi:hypothetical protein
VGGVDVWIGTLAAWVSSSSNRDFGSIEPAMNLVAESESEVQIDAFIDKAAAFDGSEEAYICLLLSRPAYT